MLATAGRGCNNAMTPNGAPACGVGSIPQQTFRDRAHRHDRARWVRRTLAVGGSSPGSFRRSAKPFVRFERLYEGGRVARAGGGGGVVRAAS